MHPRSILLSLVCCAFTICSQANVPFTSSDLEEYVSNAEANILQVEESLIGIPNELKTYENTMLPWNSLANDLLANFAALTYVANGSFPITYQADQALQQFRTFVDSSLLLNPLIQSNVLAYAQNVLDQNHTSNAYENYRTASLLNSYEQIKSTLSVNDQEKLTHLQLAYANLEQKPFIYLRGLAADKITPPELLQDTGVTIFDLNTCFLPKQLAFLHGGVAYWHERVAALADQILTVDADVVCLQEVFTEEACSALYELLKANYAHFYLNVGPCTLGCSVDSLGLPSGLFVASKYAIDLPHFTPFAATGDQVHYGVFDFVIHSDFLPLAHVYTTQLQSLDRDQSANIRAQQLQEVIDLIQADYTAYPDLNLPHFLCGDLNISWGSEEPGENLIHNYFFDAYNRGRTAVTEEDRTCTDYFSEAALSSIDYTLGSSWQIIDYALLFEPLPGYFNQPVCFGCSMKTTSVTMNFLDCPQVALSHHHGLLTTLKKARERKPS
jgi:hypothetical protein